MKRRTIVFYGNCQAFYLYRLFTEQLAPLTGDCTIHLGIGTTDFTSPVHADTVRRADVLVDQVFDTPNLLPAELAAGLKLRLRMPNLRGDFCGRSARARRIRTPGSSPGSSAGTTATRWATASSTA